MDAHQRRLVAADVAHHHREMHLAVQDVLEGDGAKASVNGRQVGFDRAPHRHFFAHPVAHEIGHRDDFQIVLARKFAKFRHPRHRAVGVHNLADDARRIQPRDARHIDNRLGLSRADEHAAVLRAQGKDVAGARQVLRARLGVNRRQNRRRAVSRRDAGRHAAPRFDGDRKRRAEKRRVVGHLHRQVQLVAPLLGEGQTDQAARVRHHEIDDFRRHHFRRARKVALVFAILIVNDDNHFAGLNIGGGFFDGSKKHARSTRKLIGESC